MEQSNDSKKTNRVGKKRGLYALLILILVIGGIIAYTVVTRPQRLLVKQKNILRM